MARKADLRKQRTGTVINTTSKKQESDLGRALNRVVERLQTQFNIRLHHEPQWRLADIVEELSTAFPEIEFECHFNNTSMRPDGGILSVLDVDYNIRPILIAEVKNQGTNDQRAREGLKKQAKGNAIERLGKNVIGFRAAMMSEGIVPFICFGYGCDFASDSSILDRVTTIAMFGPLNKLQVHNQGETGAFNRGSFFFREEQWTIEEMSDLMFEVAKRSIYYYFARYGEEWFKVQIGAN